MNNFTTAKASLAVVLALALALLPVSVQPARAEVIENYWRSVGPFVIDENYCGMGDLLV
jgi:hypothetical protein